MKLFNVFDLYVKGFYLNIVFCLNLSAKDFFEKRSIVGELISVGSTTLLHYS